MPGEGLNPSRTGAIEERTLQEVFYFKPKLLQLLEQVCFRGIDVQAAYTAAIA